MVGLWKYGSIDRYVVVKEMFAAAADPQTNIPRKEVEIMQKLKGGPQIVQLLADLISVILNDEGLRLGLWNNVVRRILMEYCSLGNLEDLLKRRIEM
jgi:hypothetical protein